MKLDHEKSFLAIALTGFISEVQGDDIVSVSFEDKFIHGVLSVGVGSPASNYDLIVDTGSSNTWVGAAKPYVVTSTSIQTVDTVAVNGRNGNFSGQEYIDQVTIASGLVIPQQSIGVANSSTGFDGVDGVLGLGPTDLTIGTLAPDSGTTIPTVTDNLFSQGTIREHLVFIASQEITFGGTDPDMFRGSITYVPITSTSPASNYWGIDATFTYGSSGTSILSTTAGIIDHRNSLILLASDSYSTFMGLTGAYTDQATGFPALASCDKLESIFLQIGGTPFEVTVEQYRWPADQYTLIGGNANTCYLAVADLGTNSGQGLDFILGYNTLKHFAVVLDTANSQVGIATGVY